MGVVYQIKRFGQLLISRQQATAPFTKRSLFNLMLLSDRGVKCYALFFHLFAEERGGGLRELELRVGGDLYAITL